METQTLIDLLNNPVTSFLIQALLASGLVRLTGGQIADVLAHIPVAGPFAAYLIRALTGNLEQWLKTRVPSMALQAVAATEERFRGVGELGPTRSEIKFSAAMTSLQALEPGVSDAHARDAIHAALTTLRGTGEIPDRKLEAA
jgi:hypothetical protein